jgi:hypothetical protein
MTTYTDHRNSEHLVRGAEHIDATEAWSDVWVYLPEEVSTYYTVTSEDLIKLGCMLVTPNEDGQVGVAWASVGADCYSLWCSECGEESTPEEIRFAGGGPCRAK